MTDSVSSGSTSGQGQQGAEKPSTSQQSSGGNSEQQNGAGPSSNTGGTATTVPHPLIAQLTSLVDGDPTKPSTSNVKVAHPLKADGSNISQWLNDVAVAVINKECAEVLQKPMPNTRGNAAALQLITGSIPEDWTLEGTAKFVAYDALLWVVNRFQGGHDKTVNKEWFRQLTNDKMTHEENLEQYVSRKYTLYENLVGNNHSLDHEDLTNAVIDCLPLEFESSKVALYTQVRNLTKTQMIQHLRVQAYALKFNDRLPRPLPRAAPANPKIQHGREGTEPKEDRRSRYTCWKCGEKGHTQHSCKKKWATSANGEGNASNATESTSTRATEASKPPTSCPTGKEAQPAVPCPVSRGVGCEVEARVALNIYGDAVNQSEEWLIDSGASVHIVNDYTLLQNPTVFAEPRPLQLATDGVKSAITASGSVCIVNSEGKPLWLHNVQYVADANTNLISVSSGIRDGIRFIPREDTGAYCAMEGPADWACRLQEKHGLYFVKGVYPTRMAVVAQLCTGPVGMQQNTRERKHSCKLRRLWHERFGHPGKTASERLTREELCTGIPVSLIPCAQCDTHCDPCVRGKQCRETFPPSKRKPPTVLHRLHADTVDATTAGVNGERYFVTVVDEHSSFCSVLPVTSKANVSSHLVDHIRKWERETDSRVHVVRTDRGTEFMNKTFHGFCAENGIHTEYSAAYTPEQNGVAERMNRTVLMKARTLLLGVQADESLWVDAVLTAAHLHNVMPVTDKEKTPFESFYGSVPDVSYLRKWGCLAYVKHPKHQVNKLGPQSEPGMFVGYCPHTKGYRVRLRDRVVVTPHVHFVESESGAGVIGLTAQEGYVTPARETETEIRRETEMVRREREMPEEEDDLEVDTPSPQIGSQVPVRGESAPGTIPPEATLPTFEEKTEGSTSTQGLPRMMDRLQAAARDVGATSSGISGVRTRAQGALKYLDGAQVPTQPEEKKTARQPLHNVIYPLTREQRLEQRNARKEAQEKAQQEELVAQQNCGEGELSAQISIEAGEDRPNEEREIIESGEVGTPVDVANCVMDEDVLDLIYDANAEEVTKVLDDKFVSPHTRFGRVHCESGQELELKNRFSALQTEEVVDVEDEEEVVVPKVCLSNAHGGRPKKGILKTQKQVVLPEEKDIDEILREIDEEAPMTASMAFLRACLASPTGVKFSKVPVPRNYKEARASEQWPFWEQAMVEEKNSLDAHECFSYVEHPRNRKVIPVHWIYSVKVDEHGNVIRYKARLVAQGCRQIDGIDVNEVFAPTSSFGARRVLLSKAAQEDLEIHQVDIKTAFLNGELEDEVYVTQPPGFHNGGNQVCRLHKALYGLKQAPRAWYKKLDATLAKHGFKACMSDAGIYVSDKPGEAPMYLVLFVDDMLLICKELDRVKAFKEAIKGEFAIHDLGEVNDFLGCQIVRDRGQKKLYMSSALKIDALVESFGMDGETRKIETPMSKSFVPTGQSVQHNIEEGAGVALEPGHRYCELIGSLLYLANTTRPDIAQAVGVLSRYRGTPTTAHMQEGLRVVRYLKGTRDYALQLGGDDAPLVGYVDADYAGDLDIRASTTGFVFQVYGGSVVWGSKKQDATANSTVEAEFRAASHAVKEAIWLRGLLEELHIPVWKTPLYCDNTGCIQNLKNPVNSKFTKHVAVSFHHARVAVIQGEVDVKYIVSHQNVADIFTKPLVPVVFHQHRCSLGVIPRLVL